MVIKTDTCSFSQFKIFPGHGKLFIERMGKSHRFINAKCESLHHQRKRPQKLTWTCTWRRMHKKGQNALASRKKRARKTIRGSRAIGGLSADQIRKRRGEKNTFRKAQQADSTRKLKEQLKARKAKKKKSGTRVTTKGRGRQQKNSKR